MQIDFSEVLLRLHIYFFGQFFSPWLIFHYTTAVINCGQNNWKGKFPSLVACSSLNWTPWYILPKIAMKFLTAQWEFSAVIFLFYSKDFIGKLSHEKSKRGIISEVIFTFQITTLNFFLEWDNGLWMPNEVFLHWNPELFGLGRLIRQINPGAFEVFSAKLSAPILVPLGN